MKEDSCGELTAIVSKQKQHSEGSHGNSAPQGGPGALHTALKSLQHRVHAPSAAAYMPVVEQAATSVDDERRETMGGGCKAADEAADCAEAKRTMDASSLQAGTESTQASAQACVVDEIEQHVRETRAADAKSKEAAEGNRTEEADQTMHKTQQQMEEPAAEAKQDLLDVQENDDPHVYAYAFIYIIIHTFGCNCMHMYIYTCLQAGRQARCCSHPCS